MTELKAPLQDSLFIDDLKKLINNPVWVQWFTQVANLIISSHAHTNNATDLTIAAGDLLKGASANTLEALAKGAANSTMFMNSAGTSPEWVATGRCVAWVHFDGTGTPAIDASYNVTSITDNGTGDYTINFTSALTDAHYVATGGAGKFDTNNDGNMVIQIGGYSGAFKSSSACRVRVLQPDDKTVRDSAEVFCAFFR